MGSAVGSSARQRLGHLWARLQRPRAVPHEVVRVVECREAGHRLGKAVLALWVLGVILQPTQPQAVQRARMGYGA